MWYGDGGVQWWEWLIGSLTMLAFWAVVAGGIWYLVAMTSRRPADRYPPHRHEPGEAERILERRLAHGEIDVEEYRRLRAVLHEGTGADSHAGPPVGAADSR